MFGLKRFIRPGFVISVVGHVGAMVLGLHFVGANSFVSKPPDAKPPDAMVVDVVPPNEAPRLEGTPADSPSSGSQSSSNSTSAGAAAQPSPQQPQQGSNPQRNARQTVARPQTTQSETAQPETAQPEMAKIQMSGSPPAPPEPHLGEAADQPVASEMFARLALLGGRLGGGFDAPAIDAPNAAHDFTVAFRERVSSCSALPAGINFGDKIGISLRVSFNPDGTLASPPQLNGAIASQKEQALMQSAIKALQKCQPYTMLPAEKYKDWKTLDLIFSPMNFPGR